MIEQAFRLAVGELGMASASWLFAREVFEAEGPEGVERLRDELGRRWPVADAVCAAWLSGARPETPEASELELGGLQRLVIVGFESRWVDALMALPQVPTHVALLRHSEFPVDWRRVLANFDGRVQLLELSDFQSWAGTRSALLTFIYGSRGSEGPFAPSAWVRVAGPDVRTQFRELIGWDVLRVPLAVYPRWPVRSPAEDFTQVARGE